MRPFSAKSFVASFAVLHALVSAENIVDHESSRHPEGLIRAQWDLSVQPRSNSTGHHVFNTVQSLLQHWPNTRYRNGHTIISATVPMGTLLYHGTFKEEVPKVPEWVATDPEHSYLFCRSIDNASGCWHLTLVTTRPLKVLYFDGSSAAKMQGGAMDSQDLVIWGEVRPEWTWCEQDRIKDICEWGKQYGLDGFMRMEMDFEIMLCDFTKGVQTVSLLNLESGEGTPNKPPPKDDPHAEAPNYGPQSPGSPPPMFLATLFRVMESGSWHNHFPGDVRIQLDYTRLISFYDTETFPSLQSSRHGQNRLDHRLDKISKRDAKVLETRLKEILSESTDVAGSGINWKGLIKTVTNRYEERLDILAYILNSTTSDSDSTVKQAHRHIRSMLAPYALHSAVPLKIVNAATPVNSSWASPVFKLCATTHTKFIDDPSFTSQFTPSEALILSAVRDVSKEICRVIVGIWAEGIEYGFAESEVEPTQNLVVFEDLRVQWLSKIESLMAWLDWSYWLKCRPACSYEEMCYLPTWPFFRSKPGRAPRPPGVSAQHPFGFTGPDPEMDDEDWVDPKPRCMRRVEPFMG